MSDRTAADPRIFQIADQIKSQGGVVSPSAIRQTMEGREPYSHIAHELERWRRERSPAAGPTEAPVLDDIEHTLKSVMEIVWRAASVQARGELRSLREGMSARLAELDTQVTDALAEVLRLEAESQFQGRQLDEIAAKLQRAEATITSRETETTTLREQFREFRQRERELQEKVEAWAARAGAAEAEVRALREARGRAAERAQSADQRPPSAH